MKSARPDEALVSVIVCAHDEGRRLHHTLKSIDRAFQYARHKGVSVEVIVVADSVDTNTSRYLQHFPQRVLSCPYFIDAVAYKNTYLSRNHGVDRAKGRLVTIINGGDLMCENWFVEAASALNKADKSSIVHPEYRYRFNDQFELWKIIASTSEDFSPWLMVENDCFPSLMMTTKETAKSHPYKPLSEGGLYGCGDRLWNCETLAGGSAHITVSGTVYAERFSAAKSSLDNSKIMPANAYLVWSDSVTELAPDHGSRVVEKQNRKNGLLRAARTTVDYIYRSRLVRFVRNSRPRVDVYITSLRNETLHLFRPITVLKSDPVPNWLYDEVRSLNTIDLRVYYLEHLGENLQHFQYKNGAFTRSYWEIAKLLSDNTDVLFLVPYLKNGGAEKLLGRHIDTVLKFDPTKAIKVLATEPADSPWAPNLNNKVKFIEPSASFHQLVPAEQGRLLALLCVQLHPKNIHIMNSVAAYNALEQYAAILNEQSSIFITIFAIDKTVEGMDTHIFVYRVQDAIDFVDRVFTDNANVVNRLTDLMAIEKSKFSVIYQPIETERIDSSKTATSRRFAAQPAKILWAGRMDREKHPETLVALAELANQKKLAVEFHAYGSPAFDMDNLKVVKNSPYVHYHGGYTGGLKSLPLADYDAFLLTSEWEGMPNVLLEAIADGLLVIASDAGGVNELIVDGETGYLVKKFDDLSEYLEKINKAIADPAMSRRLISNAQKKVVKQHSLAAYEQQVKTSVNYL